MLGMPELATTPAAVTQRRYRQRVKAARRVYSVELSEQVLSALIAAERLTPTQTLDRDRVQQELASILDEWSREWRFP